jgi:hypothetical protein
VSWLPQVFEIVEVFVHFVNRLLTKEMHPAFTVCEVRERCQTVGIAARACRG